MAAAFETVIDDAEARRNFALRYVQPGLAGLIDGSVSTLAPIFAAAFATGHNGATFLVGLRMLFTLAIYLLPWALLIFPVVMLVRWLRRKNNVTPA